MTNDEPTPPMQSAANAADDASELRPNESTRSLTLVRRLGAKRPTQLAESREATHRQRSSSAAPVVEGEVIDLNTPVRPRRNIDAVRRLTSHLKRIAAGDPPFITERLLSPPSVVKRKGKLGKAEEAEVAPIARVAPDQSPHWPDGPIIGRQELRREEIERLVRTIVTDKEIMDHETMPGLTRRRLLEAGEKAGVQKRRMAMFVPHLLVWFAQAGVIAHESSKDEDTWDRPRIVTTDDIEEIRRKLRNQSLPTKSEVETEKAKGMNDGFI